MAPSATGPQFSVTAGALASAFQSDYSFSTPTGVTRNSDYLIGAGAYVDLGINRWVQIEAEGRWLRFHSSEGDSQNNYLAGIRVPLFHHGRLTPYAKALAGIGSGSLLNGTTFIAAYGGGVEYKLSRKLSLRAGDFEYQVWHTAPTLSPYGFSVGLGYRIH